MLFNMAYRIIICSLCIQQCCNVLCITQILQKKTKQTNNLNILKTNITGTYWFQYYYCSKMIENETTIRAIWKSFKQVIFERYIQLEWWGFTVEVYTISISAFGVLNTCNAAYVRKCCNYIPLPGYLHLQSSLNELHVVIAQTCQCIGTLMLM